MIKKHGMFELEQEATRKVLAYMQTRVFVDSLEDEFLAVQRFAGYPYT